MAYVDPGSFSPGDTLTASEVNVWADDIRYLKAAADSVAFDGVSLLRSSAQSIPNNTLTSISWSSAPLDVSGWWTSGTDMTVPAGAVPSGYTNAILEISAYARFVSNGTGTRSIAVIQNGSTVEAGISVSAITGDTTQVGGTWWAVVAVGDVLDIQVKQTSGGALNADFATCHAKRIGVQ